MKALILTAEQSVYRYDSLCYLICSGIKIRVYSGD